MPKEGDMEGQVAIVTGGGSGFGRATALQLAARGASVVIGDLDEAGGRGTLDAIVAAGGNGVVVVGDVATSEGAQALVDRGVEDFGGIDVLVNNAGIRQEDTENTWACAEETWDRVLTVNLKSVYLCSKAAVPAMQARGGGAIVNVASIAASISIGGAAYAAAKAGMIGYTRHVAFELAPLGIRVNCVSPGFMRTPMSTGSSRGASTEEQESWVASRTKNVPLGRIGAADDIAHAICFLASHEASYVTGRELVVDGGFLVRGPTR